MFPRIGLQAEARRPVAVHPLLLAVDEHRDLDVLAPGDVPDEPADRVHARHRGAREPRLVDPGEHTLDVFGDATERFDQDLVGFHHPVLPPATSYSPRTSEPSDGRDEGDGDVPTSATLVGFPGWPRLPNLMAWIPLR